jgi:hypothetical protein
MTWLIFMHWDIDGDWRKTAEAHQSPTDRALDFSFHDSSASYEMAVLRWFWYTLAQAELQNDPLCKSNELISREIASSLSTAQLRSVGSIEYLGSAHANIHMVLVQLATQATFGGGSSWSWNNLPTYWVYGSAEENRSKQLWTWCSRFQIVFKWIHIATLQRWTLFPLLNHSAILPCHYCTGRLNGPKEFIISWSTSSWYASTT